MHDTPDAILGHLRALPLSRWRAELTLRHELALASPACTLVRGLMGERLRALRCLTGAPRCDGCPQARRCEFAALIGAPEAGVAGDDPRPFWWRGVPCAEALPVGARFTVEVFTVAAAMHSETTLTEAFTDALERLGTNPSRRHAVRVIDHTRVTWPPVTSARVQSVHLTALTPLQLRGDLARSRENCPSFPWLALLVSAGLRRVASLVERFGGGGPVPRVQMPHLRDVHVVEDTLRVVQTTRYTQRQEKRVPIEGWTGEVQLTGESVDAIVPLLRAMEVTGVGKGTTMGLGALGVETRP